MTAKLKKELAQQQRGSSSVSEQPRSSANATDEAVDQVEQTTGAAVHETGQHIKQSISRAVTKAKENRRQVKEQHDQPAVQDPPIDTLTPDIPEQPVSESVPQEHTPRTASRPQPSSVRQEITTAAPMPKVRPDTTPASKPEPKTRPLDIRSDVPAPKVKPADNIIGSQRASTSSVAPKIRPTNRVTGSTAPKANVSKTPMPLPTSNVGPRRQTVHTSAGLTTPKVRPETIPISAAGPKTRPASTPADPTAPKQGITAPDMGQAPTVPAPGDRMLQQAMNIRKEQLQNPDRMTTIPESGGPSAIEHYGKPNVSSSAPTVPKENLSQQNQSIYPSIKERPRRSAHLKEKPSGGTIAPKTHQNAGQIVKNVASPKNTPAPVGKQRATKHITDRARRKAQREAQRGTAHGVKQSAKTAVDLSSKATAAVAKATAKLISALSALVGGAALTAALCIIFLVGAVIASPFGILFANEPSPGAVPLNAAVSQINIELSDKLALLQSGDYDSIDVQGAGPDWTDVTAVFACKTALGADSVDVAALTSDRVDRLKAVFWDMCAINTSVETIDHPATDSTEAWTEKILHITITPKTADDMRAAYLFTGEQNNTLTELLAELNGIGSLLDDLSISQEDAAELLRRLPEDLSPERRTVVETACKLVGKVNYFWGGKSRVFGWDSRWGTIQKVWAAGSSTTGTYRPFGLDCSGFTDWVFYNISGGSYILGHGGGAHSQHTYCTPITWDQAQPGDLVFYPGDTHVGIVGGWDESGNIQIIHCSGSYNNVVITGKAGFSTIGRPMYYSS